MAALPALTDRLGYLLKHAHARYGELSAAALAPLGITGRHNAVLIAVDSPEPLSQQEIAARLGVDRTSMVALIDELAAKELVARQPNPTDRRKNVVELTALGRTTLRRANERTATVEREFLAPLSAADGQRLRRLLQAVAVEIPVPAAHGSP
jgi:DNA-binding MarR family transcriptional regulator